MWGLKGWRSKPSGVVVRELFNQPRAPSWVEKKGGDLRPSGAADLKVR